MLKSKANWEFTYKENSSNDTRKIKQLSTSSTVEMLLLQRGIYTAEQAKTFLKPSIEDLNSPALFSHIDKAASRVHQAIENGEHILVFGDYDADGVSSTSVLLEALRELGAVCDYYIPNRFTEGYGPNEQAFREAKDQGFELIITVDNGIAAVEEAEIAKELGIDLIITDHHEVQNELPDAYAIIHPKCSANYPFKELAGVGVAFKFAQHLLGYFPSHLLDLVAIGTIADLVPLVNENRILAYYGLKAISNSNRPGIKALIKQCNIEGEVNEEHIGFLIGPRINAVGRLQDANPAVDLLITEEQQDALELAAFIQQLNQDRQQIVNEITHEAEAMLETNPSIDNVIVVAKEGWNEGVLGIVASKLVRTYQRPAIVLSINQEKGQAKGSARSIDAFDLFSNCMEIRDTFIHFGGHAQAAGMTLSLEKISQLKEKLNECAAKQLTAADYRQVLRIDSTITIDELSVDLIKEIEQLAPFGMGNPKPLIHVKSKLDEVRQIGSEKNHLKLILQQDNAKLDCIGFGFGELYPIISPQSELDIIGELQINEWNGKKKPQIMLKDLSISSWQLFDYRGSKHWHNQLATTIYENGVAVTFQQSSSLHLPKELNVVHYESAFVANERQKNSDLILLDLPTDLAQLAHLVAELQPARVYACYRLENEGQYFNALPTREEFKWFYAMLLKKQQFDIDKDIGQLSKAKGWKPEKIKLIIRVFYELEFVKMDSGMIEPVSKPAKKDLVESKTYQQQSKQLEIEAVLYYSSYAELKGWFNNQLLVDSAPKEEVSNGL
ncbi:single-stranded-DNA-specific exonuclease RecJ [Aquibacillus salsiterrae]|uniref:Single-stranded-DNA-specific exonuclease RecJ n=1 Tax=Aquibacillus salsiterrae TaxID=2950439 RepID=A0A9X3WBH9_9BACI|nr:single-stranded-DNA-specific exonuclease RecJ [Aquibacillus salsiterrae]MDC3415633.1 single-stranded-DNA-specific exonuclease RecJ [Aquibacillus salsiterrae]